MTRRCRYRLGR